MIITVSEEVKRSDGTNLPMFSRAGKTTVSQYLVFSKENKTEYKSKDEEEEDDAVENPFGEKKATDLDYEMRKIQERD